MGPFGVIDGQGGPSLAGGGFGVQPESSLGPEVALAGFDGQFVVRHHIGLDVEAVGEGEPMETDPRCAARQRGEWKKYPCWSRSTGMGPSSVRAAPAVRMMRMATRSRCVGRMRTLLGPSRTQPAFVAIRRLHRPRGDSNERRRSDHRPRIDALRRRPTGPAR